jgi:hypothetical protein
VGVVGESKEYTSGLVSKALCGPLVSA